ncbi:hypothetical protein [Caldalkalibacillus salinus]|uniref:hypothetical protein n=1 Tax=Caldalkalibacillus salinus TaxID=2803787 RepID=UPI001923CE7A|nr:hypothetical protein [Caldalkalibacillus salinus]
MRYPLLVILSITLLAGCSTTTTQATSDTEYYTIEDGEKTFLEDESELLTDIPHIDTVLPRVLASFNEVTDGKREFDYIYETATEQLKQNEYKDLHGHVPLEEVSYIESDIDHYYINGLVHDKDENNIKVYVTIKNQISYEDNAGFINRLGASDHQAYHFKQDDGGNLLLDGYHLALHVQS